MPRFLAAYHNQVANVTCVVYSVAVQGVSAERRLSAASDRGPFRARAGPMKTVKRSPASVFDWENASPGYAQTPGPGAQDASIRKQKHGGAVGAPPKSPSLVRKPSQLRIVRAAPSQSEPLY